MTMLTTILVSLMLLQITLDFKTLQNAFMVIAAIVGALWLWKSGLPQQLLGSTKSLLEVRTTERDEAIKEKDKLKTEIDELEKEIRLLRRDLTQRIEINLQDQETIRDLERELRRKPSSYRELGSEEK